MKFLRNVIFFFLLIIFLLIIYQIMSSDFKYKEQNEAFWKDRLTPEVYNICRARGTEKAFSGEYNDFYKKGVYYCACCGGDYPLYSSEHKFNSGTGWPSYWQPYNDDSVEYHADTRIINKLFGAVTEVVCKRCGSHLGHVFDDGPKEHTGKRHCINSRALIFVPDGEKPKRFFNIDDLPNE